MRLLPVSLAIAASLGLGIAAPPAHAAIVAELFTERAAFDARLGGAVRVVDFDDIDTSAADPVAFDHQRYRLTHGVTIVGEIAVGGGQFASREFDPGSNMPPSSPPNEYAPGPISFVLGQGGNETNLGFSYGLQPGKVAGVGVVFIDADFSADGPSSLTIYDEDGFAIANTGIVAGGDGSHLFRGIIAVDEDTNQPVPVINGVLIVNGQGWAGNADNESVALDDLVVGGFGPRELDQGEICDNCVDDDGDDWTDRYDTECRAPAWGAALGLGDPKGAGKLALKCQKATEKAGVKFAAKRLARFHKCLGGLTKCVQLAGGDLACVAKATKTCEKQQAAAAADETKLTVAVAKGCGALDATQLENGEGLGYGAEAEQCVDLGVPSVGTAGGIATCMVEQHNCEIERMVVQTVPRAHELLALAGVDVAQDFPCLPAGTAGGGQRLATEAQQKAAVKCDAALRKASAKLLAVAVKIEQKCFDAVAACVQQKPGDAACVAKTRAKCQGALDKFAAANGGVFKLVAGTVKTCGAVALTVADLLSPAGLGFATADARCTALEYGPLTNVPALVTCVLAQNLCTDTHMVELQVPRLRELARLLDVEVPEGSITP